MSDKVLKELLREEKKRREMKDRSNNDKSKDRSNNDRTKHSSRRSKSEDSRRNKNRSKERTRSKERSQRRSKIREESVEISVPKKEISSKEKEVDLREVDSVEKFMFLYEDGEGKLYKSLDKIENEATIFPVYFEGENDNLTPEVITYRENKWTPSEENKETSWLNIINSKETILDFDEKDVVVYNGKFFHCQDDLVYYLNEYGCEYLDVNE